MTAKKTTTPNTKRKGVANITKKATKKVLNAAKKVAKKIAERELVSFDFAVKYLLRDKKGYVVLNGFLSELLGKKVEIKNLLNIENLKADKNDKTIRVDLKAQINGGEIAVFEIQFGQEFDFLGRVLFGVCSAVVDQVKAGDKYDVKKVYSVIIAYFNLNAKREYLFSGKLDTFHGVHYKDEVIPFAQTNTPTSTKLKDIHPEYYLILPQMFDEKLRSRFDEWVYVLKHSAARDDFKAAGIKEAKAKLDYLNMSPEKKIEYRRFMEIRRSADSLVLTAKAEGKREGEQEGERKGKREGKQEGLKEGLQKGLKEGLQKGLKEGLEKGLKKGRGEERAVLVKNMYKTGASVAQITKSLILPEMDVRQILGLSQHTKKRTKTIK